MFNRQLANSYKATRNNLSAADDSIKFSPWLALGSLSAPQIDQALKAFEAEHGANDSTYWIYFELLWRDYFRFLHLKYGPRLYRASGLNGSAKPPHNAKALSAGAVAKPERPGNQGNWLYIAGYGTDPRGDRRFNIAKQADEHDAEGQYRRLWA